MQPCHAEVKRGARVEKSLNRSKFWNVRFCPPPPRFYGPPALLCLLCAFCPYYSDAWMPLLVQKTPLAIWGGGEILKIQSPWEGMSSIPYSIFQCSDTLYPKNPTVQSLSRFHNLDGYDIVSEKYLRSINPKDNLTVSLTLYSEKFWNCFRSNNVVCRKQKTIEIVLRAVIAWLLGIVGWPNHLWISS